ncbi:MAG: GH32 C-terminal domain-containing protein [Clostridia bacterium]|nr:GH32 C-terminal domain-containing protein [Clostridia bacterium]
MSKSIKITFLTILAMLCFFVGVLTISTNVQANGKALESQTDTFTLENESLEKTEKFVYTATVSFERGVAAGLVFGAEEQSRYWVFNVDRQANLVKLIYFAYDENDNLVPTELITDYFIGNDKMTDSERRLVGGKVATLDKVQLKVVITPEEDGVYAEFYADNIRRFGVDKIIKLDELENLPQDVNYEGGRIGFNCFNSKVVFSDVYFGQSDYSYYTELYRNQYHFSQYAHWNNDPNGLVYYDGYYHLFYQHHPYSNYWSDMYWGHARSTDLAHWELLPICLFPDEDWGQGAGYMWSGTAYEYKKGTSTAIDNLNWYPEGNGNGLIAYYTRDGGMQDQMIMSSDDGGITWTKRKFIPQEVATGAVGKIACRDPKIFSVVEEGGKTTLWGMALTGQQADKVWFLKSNNLLDWSYAGEFNAREPECPDVVNLTANDGETYTVFTFSGREYVVGKLSYDGNLIHFKDAKGGEIDSSDFQVMDFGPDSYATQTFNISDSLSEYYGKVVSLSWYAGVPADTDSGIYANARKVWNGSGMTIPVVWNLVTEGNGYILTQTPIVKESTAFTKTQILSLSDQVVDSNTQNILSSINTHVFEMSVTIDNPDDADISIKINLSDDEYTEIGWTKEEGYFVDRTHTSSAGLNIKDYKFRYTSEARSSGRQTFYILSDNGGVEVFCDDFRIPFYVLTLASPYSVKADFSVSDTVTVENLTVKEIASVWRTFEPVEGETVLYVSEEEVKMDTVITNEKLLTAYSTSGQDITWEILEGSNVVSFENVTGGIKLTALSSGTATIKVTSGQQEKIIQVTVIAGAPNSDVEFKAQGIVSGSWYADGTNIVGSTPAGDGYILSTQSASDFKCSVNFSLNAIAAAFIFRASEDMSEYIIFNYDNNEKIVKMWSQNGEIGRAYLGDIDTNSITLRVEAQEDKVKAFINGQLVIDATLNADEPTEGYFGLNVYSGTATFKSFVQIVDKFTYSSGDLVVSGDSEQPVIKIINKTKNNEKVEKSFFTASGRHVTIKSNYFELLSVGTYVFKAYTHAGSYEFTVNVSEIPQTVLQDTSVPKGTDAIIYLGNVKLESIFVNGEQLNQGDYEVKNNILTIFAKSLVEEFNQVQINDTTLTISITTIEGTIPTGSNLGLILGLSAGGVVLAGAGVTAILFIRRKKKIGTND